MNAYLTKTNVAYTHVRAETRHSQGMADVFALCDVHLPEGTRRELSVSPGLTAQFLDHADSIALAFRALTSAGLQGKPRVYTTAGTGSEPDRFNSGPYFVSGSVVSGSA